MKMFFIAMAVFVFAQSQAQARSIQIYQDIKLYGVDENQSLTGQVVVGQINYAKQTLTFDLFLDTCSNLIPSNSPIRCFGMPQLILKFEASYRNENPGICGGSKFVSVMGINSLSNYAVTATYFNEGKQCGLDPRNQSLSLQLVDSQGVATKLHFVSRPKSLMGLLK
jgi:hypothetical protein